jgi:hypothetical protein
LLEHFRAGGTVRRLLGQAGEDHLVQLFRDGPAAAKRRGHRLSPEMFPDHPKRGIGLED